VKVASALVSAAIGCAAVAGGPACRHQPPAAASDRAQPPAAGYTAFGSGHLLRNVSDDGKYITLEDGSRWEVIPRDQFQSAEWQPQAGMTVRMARGEDGFNYELVNTTDDEGVMAKFIPK
jgi:hypothetical protein